MDINCIIVTGTISRPAQSRQTNSGKSVTGFSMTVEKEGGAYPFYLDVEAWGKAGESAMQFQMVGVKVVVEGRLEVQTWTDKQTNQKKSKAVVVASKVTPMSGVAMPLQQGAGNGGYSQAQGGYGQPQQPQQTWGANGGFGQPYAPQYQQQYNGGYGAQPPAFSAPQGYGQPQAQPVQPAQAQPQQTETAQGENGNPPTPEEQGLPF